MSLVLDGTNGLTFNNSSTQTVGGISSAAQTWQNLTGTRASGTTYTNSTGYPIMVNVDCNIGANSNYAYLTVGSLNVSFMQNVYPSAAQRMTLSAIVPNGTSYSVGVVGSSVNTWYELR
jgi:hypothetical protein